MGNATLARAARCERRAARELGTTRVRRSVGESAPDVVPILLESGERVVAEVKSRKRLPRIVTGALEQAERYAAGRGTPLAVIFHFGTSDGIASMRLRDLVRLLGLDVATLPAATALRRDPRQLSMFETGGAA